MPRASNSADPANPAALSRKFRPSDSGRNDVAWALSILSVAVLAGFALRLGGYVGGAYSWFFGTGALDDSWMPMGLAYARLMALDPRPLYDLFFVDHVKFQYPPSSLLLYSAFDALGITPNETNLNRLVWLSILAMPVLTFFISIAAARHFGGGRPVNHSATYATAAAFAVAVLFFYPIMIAWRLGQVQALLNLAFAVACLCWLHRRHFWCGVAIGLICLVKPQFSLFLVWAVVRGNTAFAAGQLCVLAVGLTCSVVLFGFSNHIEYVSVIRYISQRGEIFWDNTSVNGFVNGLNFPDQVLKFDYKSFPPVTTSTYLATALSSLVILAYALMPRRRAGPGADVLDFLTAAIAFTLASPIAWGHHYGIAYPVLVVLFAAIAANANIPRRRNRLLLWGLCVVLMSNYWNVSERLAGTFASPLQSWRLIAVVGILILLHRLQVWTVEAIVPDTTWQGEPSPSSESSGRPFVWAQQGSGRRNF